ncbi:MAG: hypothetical protein OER74_18545, partial [Desulfobacteraceae bacterium]|nr:hypothetical protein [Desulfobacteraceae bacterium]
LYSFANTLRVRYLRIPNDVINYKLDTIPLKALLLLITAAFSCQISICEILCGVIPNAAKVEDTVDPRRQG